MKPAEPLAGGMSTKTLAWAKEFNAEQEARARARESLIRAGWKVRRGSTPDVIVAEKYERKLFGDDERDLLRRSKFRKG
jgi:hypothetical protein